MRRVAVFLALLAVLFAGVGQYADAQIKAPGRLVGTGLRYPSVGSGLTRWDAALAASRAGTAGAVIAFVGDSTTAGLGSTTPAGQNNYPYKLYQALLAKGYPVVYSGMGGFTASATADSRVVLSGGASTPTGLVDARWSTGYALTSAGAISFTQNFAIETADIYFAKGPISGIAEVRVDGGAVVATLNSNSASLDLGKATITASLGSHTISITWVSGSVYPLLVDAYNASAKMIRLVPGGVSGDQSNQASVSGGFNVQALNAALTPALTLYDYGINDADGGVSLSAYQSQVQSFLTAADAYGDVVLIGFNEVTGGASAATQQTYRDRLATLAAAAPGKVKYIPVNTALGTYAAANAAGWMADTKHPNSAGYAVYVVPLAAGI